MHAAPQNLRFCRKERAWRKFLQALSFRGWAAKLPDRAVAFKNPRLRSKLSPSCSAATTATATMESTAAKATSTSASSMGTSSSSESAEAASRRMGTSKPRPAKASWRRRRRGPPIAPSPVHHTAQHHALPEASASTRASSGSATASSAHPANQIKNQQDHYRHHNHPADGNQHRNSLSQAGTPFRIPTVRHGFMAAVGFVFLVVLVVILDLIYNRIEEIFHTFVIVPSGKIQIGRASCRERVLRVV